jgi:hypothetical protein
LQLSTPRAKQKKKNIYSTRYKFEIMKLAYILLAIFVVFANASGLLDRQIDLTYECAGQTGTCKIDGIAASCDGKTSLFRGSFDGSIEITNSDLDLSGCSREDEGEALVKGSGTTLDVTRNFWRSNGLSKVTACAIRAKVLTNPKASAFNASVIGQNGFSPYCQDRQCTGVSADKCAGSAHVGDSLLPGDGLGGGFDLERRVDELVKDPSYAFDSLRGNVLTVTLADHDSLALSPAFQAVRLSGVSICNGDAFAAFETGLKSGDKNASHLPGLFDTSFSAQSHSSIASAFARDAFALSTSTPTADATITAHAVAAVREWTFASSAWKILNSGVSDSPATMVDGNMIKSQDIVLDIVHIHPILGPLDTAGEATNTRAFATCQTRKFVVTTDLDANVVVGAETAVEWDSRLVVESFEWGAATIATTKIFVVKAHVDIYDIVKVGEEDANFQIHSLTESCANVGVSTIASTTGQRDNFIESPFQGRNYTRNSFTVTYSKTGYIENSLKIAEVFGDCAVKLQASKIISTNKPNGWEGMHGTPRRPVYSIDVSQVNIQDSARTGGSDIMNQNRYSISCQRVDGNGAVYSENLCNGGTLTHHIPLGYKIKVTTSASVDPMHSFLSAFDGIPGILHGNDISLPCGGQTGANDTLTRTQYIVANSIRNVHFSWTGTFTTCNEANHARRRLQSIAPVTPSTTSYGYMDFFICDPSLEDDAAVGACGRDLTSPSVSKTVNINRKINIAPVLNSLTYANGEITFATNVNNILHNEGNEHQLQIFEFGRKTTNTGGVPNSLECNSKHVTQIGSKIIDDSNGACYYGLPDQLSAFTLQDLYTNVTSWETNSFGGGKMTDLNLGARKGSPTISYTEDDGDAIVGVTAQRNQIDGTDGCNVGCVRSDAGVPSTSCKFDFIVRTLTPDGYPLENYPRLAQICHRFEYEVVQSDRVDAQTAFQSSRGEVVGVQDIEWKLDPETSLWDLHVTLVYEHRAVGGALSRRALNVAVGTVPLSTETDDSVKAAVDGGVAFTVVRAVPLHRERNGATYYYTELELKRAIQYNYTGGSQCDWDAKGLSTNAFSIDISPSKCEANGANCYAAQLDPSDAAKRLYRKVLVNIDHFNSCPKFSNGTGEVANVFDQSTFQIDAHGSAVQSSNDVKNTFSENEDVFIRLELNNTVNRLKLHPNEYLQFDSVVATAGDTVVTFWGDGVAQNNAADCSGVQCTAGQTCLDSHDWVVTPDWVAENIIRFPAAPLRHKPIWDIKIDFSVHSCHSRRLRRRLLEASDSGTLDATGTLSATVNIHIIKLNHEKSFDHISLINAGTFNSHEGINIGYQVTQYGSETGEPTTTLTLSDGASCDDDTALTGACKVAIPYTGDSWSLLQPWANQTRRVVSFFDSLVDSNCISKTVDPSSSLHYYQTKLLLDTKFQTGDGGDFNVCSEMALSSSTGNASSSSWQLTTQSFVGQDRFFSAVLDGLPKWVPQGNGEYKLSFALLLDISDSTRPDMIEKRRRLVDFKKDANYNVTVDFVSNGNLYGNAYRMASGETGTYSVYRLRFLSVAKDFSGQETACTMGDDDDFSFSFKPLSCLKDLYLSACNDAEGVFPTSFDNVTEAGHWGYEDLTKMGQVGVTVNLNYDYTICPNAASNESVTINDVAAQSFEIVASTGDIKATAAELSSISASDSKFFAGDTVYADFRIDSNDTSDNIGLEFQEVTLCHYTDDSETGDCSNTDSNVDKIYHLVVGRNVAGEYATALKAQTCWQHQRAQVEVSETATYETGACQSTCSFGSLNSTASTAFDVLTFKTDTSMMAASGSTWVLVASANRVRCDYSRNSGGRRLLSVPEKVHFRKLLSIPVGSATVAVSDSVGFQILPPSGASLSYPNKMTAKLSSTSETTTDASKSNTLVYVLVVVVLVAGAVILGTGMCKKDDIGVVAGVNPTGGTEFRVRRNTRMRRSRVVYKPVLSHE